MNFISEIFEFGALQIQPAARWSEGASIGFGTCWQPFLIASCCWQKEHRFTQGKNSEAQHPAIKFIEKQFDNDCQKMSCGG